MNNQNSILLAFIILSFYPLSSCSNDNVDAKKTKKAEKPVIIRKDTSSSKAAASSSNAPIINIADTVALKANVIYIKDSAATSYGLSKKLAQIYNVKLAEVVKQNKLKVTGAPIAWYKTQKAPYFFEAGIPVDKKPSKLSKKVFFRVIGGDSAVIAHFYGPYDQTGLAYEALTDFFKDRKRKLRAPAYEVYIGDPFDKDGKPIDPFKVQTDIIFPY